MTLAATVTDADSGVNNVQFQRSPAGAGSWTNIGAADATSPYSTTLDTTTLTDGFYDLRAVATDDGGTVANIIFTTRVDNASPDQNLITLNELTGPTFQYWDSATRTQYYNPVGGNGTFSLASVPRDVLPQITYVGGVGTSNVAANPLTITNPGIQTGDLLLAQVGFEVAGVTTITPPAGWTQLLRKDNGTIYGQIIFSKVATAADVAAASFSFTHSSATANMAGGIVAYRNVATAAPFDAYADQQNAVSTTAVPAPSITTTSGCTRLVGFFSIWDTSTMVAPAAMTERYDAVTAEPGWD